MRGGRDRGSITPLVVGAVFVAGLLVTATIAASAAFLAHRDLAGLCDGAAVAAAAAATTPDPDGVPRLDPARVAAEIERYRIEADPPDRADPSDRTDRAIPPGRTNRADPSDPADAADPADPADPADRTGAGTADPSLVLEAGTDGRTVTVICSRRVEIPFGAVLGAPHGLDRTVVARARPLIR
ncbi:MAG TPA: hypothetical protein VF109_00585 [Mycobacteriales bacterium]